MHLIITLLKMLCQDIINFTLNVKCQEVTIMVKLLIINTTQHTPRNRVM